MSANARAKFRIGMPVEVTYQEIEDVTLPVFRPATKG